MKKSPLLLGMLLLCPLAARAEDPASCAEFNALVKRTYNFDESRLTDAQKRAKEAELDRFWTRIKSNKAKFLPCLRAKVADPKANAFFRFDGSNLLVAIEPSLASKRAQVQVYTDASLGLIGAERWVSILTSRGTEGFDVSKAAKRALDDEAISYVPSNAEYADEMSHFDAARFLWASQDEARATAQLFALANNPNYVQREAALSILLDQATPEARVAVQKVNRDGLSQDGVAAVEQFLRAPEAVTPRAKPKTSRAKFLSAFNRVLAGDLVPFSALSRAIPDGEHDAAAVLLPTDLPLLHRVRRRFLVGCNEHSLNYYHDFTGIIFAIMKKEARAPKV